MTTVIENNFFEVQKKTTQALVQQRVIVSEQEIIDGFLDHILETKKNHVQLISDYRALINSTVEFLSESRSIGELILIAEGINNLVDTTKRFIKALEDVKFNHCYANEVKEFKLLMSDIQEILIDVQNRTKNNNELIDLLNNM